MPVVSVPGEAGVSPSPAAIRYPTRGSVTVYLGSWEESPNLRRNTLQRGWEHRRHRHHYGDATASTRKPATATSAISSTPPAHSTETSTRTRWRLSKVAEGLDDVEALMDKLLPRSDHTAGCTPTFADAKRGGNDG